MKHKPDPRLKGIAEALKDPKCFKSVEKQIQKAGQSEHEHKSIITWNKCKHCQQKFLERRAKIVKLGFKNYEQYLAWKNVMAHFLTISKGIKYEESK